MQLSMRPFSQSQLHSVELQKLKSRSMCRINLPVAGGIFLKAASQWTSRHYLHVKRDHILFTLSRKMGGENNIVG
jgi:hypothetical protein